MAFKPDKRLRSLYSKYNQYFWDGKLPEGELVVVGYDEEISNKLDGLTIQIEEVEATNVTSYIIALDPAVKHFPRHRKLVLLHEMAHVALNDMRHGKKFEDEANRLVGRGALREFFI